MPSIPEDEWSRRAVARALSANLLVLVSWSAAEAQPLSGALTPEMFGAKGDGVADDSAAFRKLGEAISDADGGTIVLRRTVYRVGAQRPLPGALNGYIYADAELLVIRGCGRPVRIVGNGATLRAAPGLRFGVFDPATGARRDRPMPNLNPQGRATPYHQMVLVQNCSGGVLVEDLTLDGNSAAAMIGGRYGDLGWQIPASGLVLEDNSGDEVVRRLRCRNQLLDGVIIRNRTGADRAIRMLEDVTCEGNGRQGMSVVAGNGYRFTRCVFTRTGRGKVSSAPGAGVDIEAESGPIARLAFVDCRFSDNVGAGMVADSGPSTDVSFTRCTFVGTTNCALWPNKPFFRFRGCTIVGQILKCHTSDRPAEATQFVDCSITDDPARSPTGKVFATGPIADLSTGTNVRFERCRFSVTRGASLPWSWKAVYVDCTMRQVGGKQSYPRGRWIGHSTITGDVDLASSTIAGSVTINGVRHV